MPQIKPYTRKIINQYDETPIESPLLNGGLAYGKSSKGFDPIQLEKGLKIEKEHTSNELVALRISMDHLTEFPNYYDELEKMEKRMEKEKKEGM